MKIISDFSDYYDSVLSFGSDPNIIYLRKKEEYKFRVSRWLGNCPLPQPLGQALQEPLKYVLSLPPLFEGNKPRSKLFIPIAIKVIGFCGFLYAALEIDGTVCYSTDQILPNISDGFLKTHAIKRNDVEVMIYRETKRWRQKEPSWKDRWEKSVAQYSGKRFDDVFIDLGVPIMMMEYILDKDDPVRSRGTVRVTINAPLKTIFFWKIKPPAEAFQEISMYLGNQLARQLDPGATIPDEILRDEKGFDKWSFRSVKV